MITIFNRNLLKIKKNNAFASTNEHDFLKQEVGERFLERLDEIKQNFAVALHLGAETGIVAEYLHKHQLINNKIGKLYQADYSINALKQNKYDFKINLDEEQALPFKNNCFDLVIAPFSLQNINNLDNCFKEIYRILTPNGLFMASFPTYGTLENLQKSLFDTEIKLYKRASPRVHPFSDIQTLGNILQNNKFSEIVADLDSITIMYKDFNKIFKDLKKWGNNNIQTKLNPQILSKNFFKFLKEDFEQYKDVESNHYPITVNFCNLIGWKV